jgi:putative nucleotidyltransferase with HDIG domain
MNGKIFDKETAEELLAWAGRKNPGKWIEHSYNTAKSAEIIAKECALDNNFAYVLGLLHDIGRYEGVTSLKHVYSGYKLMKEKGCDNIARICLTHSFPYKNLDSFQGNIDCTLGEINYLKTELEKIEYDDYDKLIQLCDGISLAEGITLLEIRIADVVKRYGFNEYTLDKWNAFFGIKKYFENKCNKNIYELFKEEIIEKIFSR